MRAPIRPVALVTGGSRGIGAATALALAQRGYDVAITYRNKARRAEAVRAELARLGAGALAVAGDLTREDDRARLLAAVAARHPRLDLLVLNASGGLERDLVAADPDYPTRINRDAQVALVEAAAPLLAPGATVVFVTSHWAHLHGRVEQLPAYEPVAASKHAGEAALRGRQADLAGWGVRLLVVTGDLVEGTITPRLLERAARGLAAARRAAGGSLPTAAGMGEAIAGAAANPALPSGHTVVVGGALDSLPRRLAPSPPGGADSVPAGGTDGGRAATRYVIRPAASAEEFAATCDVIGAQITPPFTRSDRRFHDLARRFPEDQPLMLVVCEQSAPPPPSAPLPPTPQAEASTIVGGALAFRTSPRAVTLRMIGLEPRVRGQGVGRRLMAALELAAVRLGADAIALGADRDTRGFYARLGYAGRGAMMHKGLPLPGPAVEARLRKLAAASGGRAPPRNTYMRAVRRPGGRSGGVLRPGRTISRRGV
jgi:NAD(P)-dependent dehydrogenase (short-subunit alcohol dehydrogenase family)/ribosomal protein S18 acetylase RimI-like enzyme